LGTLVCKKNKFLYKCQFPLVGTKRIEFKIEIQTEQHIDFIPSLLIHDKGTF
jgi:hypothetical protein